MIKKIALWMRDMFIRNRSLNATRVVAVSFAVIILVGALLLTLPIASRSGESAGFFTGLFTATSATCVTGLILVDTWTQWSLFGQVVILAMIQLGGLGFMTVITLVSFALHRRIGLSERLIMVSTLNLNDLDGVVRVVRHALMGTFLLEGIGAVILSVCMIPEFGIAGGIWRGIFHAVSAFCNAGFDLLGGRFGAFSSLVGYNDHPVVLLTIAALIMVGGLGFFVWEDILRKRSIHRLSVYSKMVLLMTALLIVGGAAFFLVEEYANPATLGNMPFWQKLCNALFQSVTLRTAGFDAIGQGGLSDSSKAFSSILMLIGGSSGSTAGGLKTATVAVLLLALRSGLAGREQVTFRGRTIPYRRVLNAMTLALVMLFLFLVGSMVISTVEGLPYLDCAFEVASAMGTVGLTTGLTPNLTPFSQTLIILLMYLGRVGVLSFSIALMTRGRTMDKIRYPEMNVMIG
ncbi:potassium transporter TrkG [Flavonifractor sp. An306]|uniref:TrkH family potassium uptake protein n=1 Tax=Flavonifractor sp. An306 TaxID=1965629 RepID=UPI000B378477|nr:potassium transporter TrkG [Flavonifractor sp. An306]OUO43561.1 potassium uptake protein, TrkH family [Flavonifractor sp. An306]